MEFNSVKIDGNGVHVNERTKSREETFVFTDERFKKFPHLKPQLAKEFDTFVGQRLEQEEAKELVDKLTSLRSIGYEVEIRSLPTPEEEAKKEGYEEGYAAARRDLKKIATAALPLVGAVIAGILFRGRNNSMY